MRRLAAGALLGALGVMSFVAPASSAQARDLYVYGHSLTTGAGLDDPALVYTRLIIDDEHWTTLHSFGVNGSLVHEAAERLYGTGEASWSTGTSADVLIEANLNTARDFGADPLALATSRNALRVMLATVDASRRIEDSNRSHTWSAGWRTQKMSWASGGAVHVTTRNNSYVEFKAIGGEYVSIRGVSGAGATIRLSDRTTGHTVTRIKTGKRVHPAYDHAGVPVVYRIPPSMAKHTIRMTKESGTGSFTFDARLPQRSDPGTVILVEEPYLADYSLSTAHPNGSDAAIDAFNGVLDTLANEFSNALTVDLDAAGWDPAIYLQADGVHPNEAGNRFMADAVDVAYDAHMAR